MHRSKIEWVLNPDNKTLGWIWNPLTGCRNHVDGMCKGGNFPCYAYRLANGRLKQRYLANENIARSGYPIPKRLDELPMDEDDPFYPRYWEDKLLPPLKIGSAGPRHKKGKGIFVCVSGDTKVSLVDGGIKQIKDICVGDAVIGYNNGKAESSKVTAIRETHSPEVYRLLVSGNELIGSPSHPVLTPLGYKRLDKLSSGEYICMYEHTQSMGRDNSQMCRSLNRLIGDRHSISCGDNRRRGDYLIQENDARLLPPNPRDSEFRRTAYQLADSDILAEARGGSQWLRGALSASAPNRLRDCSLFGGDRAFPGKQEPTGSTGEKVHLSKNTATLERATLSRNGGNLQGCSPPQFSWCRVKAIERVSKAEILYDITTTSHNFVANGIVTHNCDMSDLFGIGIPEEWTRRVLSNIKHHWTDRFYLLTKQPQNLTRFSPFPDNCWVGVSATNTEMLLQACSSLEYPVEAKVKYLSIEPFLDWSFNWNESYLINAFKRAGIKCLIIGAQTKPYKPPKIEWVKEIVNAADKAGIPVFQKDNLKPLLCDTLRQELPQ